MKDKTASVGIALSGGGARAYMHLGVLAALEEAGIRIDALSGTSAGGVVGAFYAAGFSPKECLKLLSGIPIWKKLGYSVTGKGFLNLNKLETLFKELLPCSNFEELKIPLTINATDLREGQSVYFQMGTIIPPMLGACCLPGLFAPYPYQSYELVDGGVLNNLPIEPLQSKVTHIVGSQCNAFAWERPLEGKKDILMRSFLLAIHHANKDRLGQCALMIEPPEMRSYSLMDFQKATSIYEMGYAYTMRVLSRPNALLG